MRFPLFGSRKAKLQPRPAEPQAKVAAPPGTTKGTVPEAAPKVPVPSTSVSVSALAEAPGITAPADGHEAAAAAGAADDIAPIAADAVTAAGAAVASHAGEVEAHPEAAEVTARAEAPGHDPSVDKPGHDPSVDEPGHDPSVDKPGHDPSVDELEHDPWVDEPENDPWVDEAEMMRSARAAREAGRIDEARTVLRLAAERFPRSAGPRHDLARMAEADHDWPEAERWWREFGLLQPTTWWVITQTAHVVRLQGRPEEAEALLAAALERLPAEVQLFVHYARIAETRRDWREAAARWAVVAERFPDTWEGPVGQARILREQGRLDEARALLGLTVERFPEAAEPIRYLAVFAEIARDWTTAERCWRALLSIEPGPSRGYVGLALALREQQRTAEAEEILTAQLESRANDPTIFIEYAWLAERSNDGAGALQRWDHVVSRFPDMPQGYTGQARMLRALGRLDEARTVLLDAAERFPTASGVPHDLARLAEAQRDWPEAERRWRAFLVMNPAPIWAHAALANALQEQKRLEEAEQVFASQFDRYAQDPAIYIEHARLAERRGDWAETLDRWQSVASRFPHAADGYSGQARVLRGQGRLDEARAVLAQGIELLPSASGLIADLAAMASAQRDWPEAEQRWQAFLAIDPAASRAYVGLALALREQQRIAEAEAVLAGQFERFPGDPSIFIEYAWLSERSADLQERSKRWDDVVSRFPNLPQGYSGQARALRAQGRPQEARGVLLDAFERIPKAVGLIHDLARLAEAQQDWAEAERFWGEYLAIDPSAAVAHSGFANALQNQERLDEAEAALTAQLERHPDQPANFIEHARLAERGGDWAEALTRWQRVASRFPDRVDGFNGQARALRELGRTDDARTVLLEAAERFPAAPALRDELAQLG